MIIIISVKLSTEKDTGHVDVGQDGTNYERSCGICNLVVKSVKGNSLMVMTFVASLMGFAVGFVVRLVNCPLMH